MDSGEFRVLQGDLGQSNAELARVMGVHANTLSGWRSGRAVVSGAGAWAGLMFRRDRYPCVIELSWLG